MLVGRLDAKQGSLTAEASAALIEVLCTLVSFECFDLLAGPDRSLEDVAPLVQRLARAALSSFTDPDPMAGHG